VADIFLSYAREDELRARAVAGELESRGWSVFWDRRIPTGHDFGEHLQQQINAARCIVVLWSKASVASRFVRDEATEGLDGRLVPALIEAVNQPLGFRQLQAADLRNWHGERPHREFDWFVDSIAIIVAAASVATSARSHPAPPAPGLQEKQVATEVPGRASPDRQNPIAGANFDADVLVSAAPLDNVQVIEGRNGWVQNLVRALDVRIPQLAGARTVIWWDPLLLHPDEHASRMKRVAVFVAVLSPRYLTSKKALKQLSEFWKAQEEQVGEPADRRARVFKVIKMPVPLEKQPRELQGLPAYDFFMVDRDTGRVREFEQAFGPEAERDFWLALDDLARDISRVLGDLSCDHSFTDG
jgi:hypothetical protein